MGYKQQMAKVEAQIRPAIETTCAAHHDSVSAKFAVDHAPTLVNAKRLTR